MSDENVLQVDEKKCCLDDAKPKAMETIEETYVETMAATSKETNSVNLRQFSTGVLDKQGPSKAQAQTRYRGNQLSSTHDLCKHGKRREESALVIKPLKLVKKKNVEGEVRKSLGNVVKPEKPLRVAAKKDVVVVSEIVESGDGLRGKRSETKSTINTPKGSPIVRKVTKTNLDFKNVSRINENKSTKEDVSKGLKNKEKINIDEHVTRCEDVLEKALYVVESTIEAKEKKMKKKSITSTKSEIQPSSEKKGGGKKSLNISPSLSLSSKEVKESTKSGPKPIRESPSRFKNGLSEKKEIGYENVVNNSKTESKIRPKRIGLKITPPPQALVKQLSFKKGKVLELKQEESTSKTIKFKKRVVVQEPKLINGDVNNKRKIKKSLKEVVWKMNGEGKREKVVLRHRKVEVKKKMQTLFNNVIEETVNKLEEVRKSKVKALVGAFETVISLQDNDKMCPKKKKIQSKSISSSLVVE